MNIIKFCWFIITICIIFIGILILIPENNGNKSLLPSKTSNSEIPCIPNPLVWDNGVTYWPQGAILCK